MSLETAIATMDAKKSAIMAVIPTTMRETMEWQMIRQSVAAAIRGNDSLQRADPMPIFNSAMYISRLGLEIGGHGGEAFLVPFKGKCTPMIGVRGKEVLAIRSGHVDSINSGVLHEFDLHDHDLSEAFLTHKLDWTRDDRGKALGAWAKVYLTGSPRPLLELMPECDFQQIVKSVMRRNKGKLSPSYREWPDEQRRNRVLSRLLKRTPKSKDMARVLFDEHHFDQGVQVTPTGYADVIDAETIPNVDLTYDDPPERERSEPKVDEPKTDPQNENPAPKKGQMP